MISGPFPHFEHSASIQTFMSGIPSSDATSPLMMPSPSTSPCGVDISDIRCRVCERKYDGSQHFGIDICRACAAFFRRSVFVKKTFVCRRGTDLCRLNTISRKTTCQKCRWMRCLQVGLQIDLVLTRRSPDNTKPPQESAPRLKQEDDESDGSGSDGKYPEMPMLESTLPHDKPSVVRPIPTSGNPNLDTTQATLINKVLKNYNEFTRQRLEVELSVAHANEDSKIIGSTGVPIYKATRETVSLIYQKQVHLLDEFLRNTFDEYTVCEVEEQKRICAMFYPVLWEIESCYWTYRNIPQSHKNLLMCTQTTYIDSQDVRFWLGNTDGEDEKRVEFIETRLKNLLEKAHSLIVDEMHKKIIKEFEFITLLALNIWAPRNHRGHPNSEERANTVRTALFQDIHVFYHDGLKIDNYALRMGEVMVMYTDVQNADISSTVQELFFSGLADYINSI